MLKKNRVVHLNSVVSVSWHPRHVLIAMVRKMIPRAKSFNMFMPDREDARYLLGRGGGV